MDCEVAMDRELEILNKMNAEFSAKFIKRYRADKTISALTEKIAHFDNIRERLRRDLEDRARDIKEDIEKELKTQYGYGVEDLQARVEKAEELLYDNHRALCAAICEVDEDRNVHHKGLCRETKAFLEGKAIGGR